jgi:integrase/recombinase XerD
VSGDALKQRRVTDRVNTLLKVAGRNIKLPKLKKPRKKVRYINLEQLFQLLQVTRDDFLRDLFAVAFGTGGRVGECLNIYNVSDGRFIYIEEQLRRESNEPGETKTRRERRAPIVSELEEHCRRFAKYPENTRKELERTSLAKYLRVRCKRAGVPYVDMNGLRHSYAIHLLRRGVSMTLVAQALGNSIQVCQEFYAGFELSTESLEQVVGKI